ncbi:MAG: hypothetical protein NVV62_11935 [Terricaulis sp.]|nr:hypothetical protein [Terricaulis sp.]
MSHAEARDPAFYEHLGDAKTPGVFLALRLSRATSEGAMHDLAPTRAGVIALARALGAGVRHVRFSPPAYKARAA